MDNDTTTKQLTVRIPVPLWSEVRIAAYRENKSLALYASEAFAAKLGIAMPTMQEDETPDAAA